MSLSRFEPQSTSSSGKPTFLCMRAVSRPLFDDKTTQRRVQDKSGRVGSWQRLLWPPSRWQIPQLWVALHFLAKTIVSSLYTAKIVSARTPTHTYNRTHAHPVFSSSDIVVHMGRMLDRFTAGREGGGCLHWPHWIQ